MTRFARALREFGEESFDFEVLERCPKEALLEREKFYIVFLGAAEIDGLNSRENPCATYDVKVSDVTRARISASKKGILHTPEHRIAQSLGQIGLKRSDAVKLKMSFAMRGIPKSDSHKKKLSKYRTGLKTLPETREKQRRPMLGRIVSSESKEKRLATLACKKAILGESYGRAFKPILATDLVGNVLRIFDSLLEAVAALNIPNTSLRKFIKTGTSTPAGMLVYYVTVIPDLESHEPAADIQAPLLALSSPIHPQSLQ